MAPTAVISGLTSIMSFMLAPSTVFVDGTEWSEPLSDRLDQYWHADW